MNEFAKTAYWLDCADYDLQTAKAMLETKLSLCWIHVPPDHRERIKSSLCSAAARQRTAIYSQLGAPCQPIENHR